MAQKLYNSLDLQQLQLLNAVAHKTASDIATPVEGQFWYNTTEGALKVKTGGAIQTLATASDLASVQADVDANTAAIASINTLLGSNDINLDTVQEVVDFIKNNKSTIDALSMDSIANGTNFKKVSTALYDKLVALRDDATLQSDLDAKVNVADVVDNLTSTSSTAPLSANQGRILDGKIATANTNIAANATAIATIQTEVAGLDTRIDAIEPKVTSLETSQATQDTAITGLTTRVTTLETTVEALGGAKVREEKSISVTAGTPSSFSFTQSPAEIISVQATDASGNDVTGNVVSINWASKTVTLNSEISATFSVVVYFTKA